MLVFVCKNRAMLPSLLPLSFSLLSQTPEKSSQGSAKHNLMRRVDLGSWFVGAAYRVGQAWRQEYEDSWSHCSHGES